MAQKRMFTMKIVDSDAFLDMPLSAQCLYFHLTMRADDDGFIGNAKRIMRTVGCHEDDMKILIAKRFVLVFEDGIIVIKHWRMHNCITQNRYHETQYLDEKRQLRVKENKAYSLTEGEPLGLVENEELPEIPDDDEEPPEAPKGRPRNEYPVNFETFWAEYPRKDDKGMAYQKYKARIKSGYSPEELLFAAERYKEECEAQKKEKKFIKQAKTFLGDATPFVDYLERRMPENPGGKNAEADFKRYL